MLWAGPKEVVRMSAPRGPLAHHWGGQIPKDLEFTPREIAVELRQRGADGIPQCRCEHPVDPFGVTPIPRPARDDNRMIEHVRVGKGEELPAQAVPDPGQWQIPCIASNPRE